MLRIQRMAMSPAIRSPKVVVVDLRRRQRAHRGMGGKYLTIYGAVVGFRLGLMDAWAKLGGTARAVLLSDHKSWPELHQESLFQRIAHAVLIGVDLSNARLLLCW